MDRKGPHTCGARIWDSHWLRGSLPRKSLNTSEVPSASVVQMAPFRAQGPLGSLGPRQVIRGSFSSLDGPFMRSEGPLLARKTEESSVAQSPCHAPRLPSVCQGARLRARVGLRKGRTSLSSRLGYVPGFSIGLSSI